MDKEKIIKGFEICKPSKYSRTCGICPYREEMNCDYEVYNDVLSLLKEQEAVEPEYGGDMEGEQIRKQQYPENGTWWYECGYCRTPIDYRDRFCRHCGKLVKWK